MKSPTLLSCGLLLLTACSGTHRTPSSHKQREHTEPSKEPAGNTAAVSSATAAPPDVRLEVRQLKPLEYDLPQCQIMLIVDDKVFVIDTVSAAAPLKRASYSEYDIPGNAIAALGGWYAGSGDYFYIILENNRPVLYCGWQDEGQEGSGYHWKRSEKRF